MFHYHFRYMYWKRIERIKLLLNPFKSLIPESHRWYPIILIALVDLRNKKLWFLSFAIDRDLFRQQTGCPQIFRLFCI
jgi:hypothetical protein